MVVYYLIKHVKSCVFSCLNNYKIVGKGLGKVVLEVNCLH